MNPPPNPPLSWWGTHGSQRRSLRDAPDQGRAIQRFLEGKKQEGRTLTDEEVSMRFSPHKRGQLWPIQEESTNPSKSPVAAAVADSAQWAHKWSWCHVYCPTPVAKPPPVTDRHPIWNIPDPWEPWAPQEPPKPPTEEYNAYKDWLQKGGVCYIDEDGIIPTSRCYIDEDEDSPSTPVTPVTPSPRTP